MSGLHHRDPVIRALGALLLAAAWLCLRRLFTGPAASGGGDATDAIAAAAGFVGASLGSTLLLLGRHIHDPVPLSARWSRRSGRRGG